MNAIATRELQDIGRRCAEGIAERVAALDCDYARLEELRAFLNSEGLINSAAREELEALEKVAGECTDREHAERLIQEEPLCVEVRSEWVPAGELSHPNVPAEFRLLLGTGGPATRIVGTLDANGEPENARIESQDWGQPWTEYLGEAVSPDDLLTYCRQFYFGEG